MGFRENLQHLRATRNMTQEQLAMLLGVSRQSVTKWEAAKSYPEMDKLLKMCQIFECSLDDLVTGDVTALAGNASSANGTQVPVPDGPPQDICGYDEHQRMMAFKVPTGVAAILVMCGIAFLFEGSFSFMGGDADTLMIMLILLGVLVGLAFAVPAGMEHAAFMKAHPYIEDFYTEDDRASARRDLSRAIVAGVAAIFVGVACIMVFGEHRDTERQGLCLLMLFVALGVWLIVRYGMLLGRMNIAEYNKSAAEELEMEDIVNAQVEDEIRDAMIAHKRSNKKLGAICGAIMIAATIIGLALLFIPVFSAADPSDFDPVGTSAMWFWVVWPVGGMICGIVALLMEGFSREK